MHERVGLAGLLLGEAPVHRQENGPASDPIGHHHLRGEVAAAGADRRQLAVAQLQLLRIAGVDLQQRFRVHGLQPLHLSGAGHRVPLAQVAAHRQHQGVGVAGWFRQPQRLVGAEPGPAIGGGKAVIAVQALGWLIAGAATGERPLLRALLFQQRVAEARHVTQPTAGELAEFGVHLCGRCIAELVFVAQSPSHLSKHLPVRPALPETAAEGRAVGDPSFRVGHRSCFLAPLGGGQQHVGVVGRL